MKKKLTKKTARKAPKKPVKKATKRPAKKAPKAEPRKMTPLKELAEQLGVTERTVRAWTKRGCPCRRVKGKGGGRARLWFHHLRVSEWLGVHGIEVQSNEPEAPPPTLAAPPPGAVKDPDLPKSGIVGAVARLRAMERLTYAAFLQSMQASETADKVRSKERLYIEAHQALRRTEAAVPKILENRGDMIPLETVLQEQAKIDLAVKNQFLTLPRKISVQLASIADPGEIEELLEREIDDCLRHIASGGILQDEAPPDV